MVDDCSCLWNFPDSQLLVHFNLIYPHNQPWQLCQLRKPIHCALTCVLLMRGYYQVLRKNEPWSWTTIGPFTMHSGWNMILTSTCKHGMTRCPSPKYLADDIKMEGSPPPHEHRQSSHTGGCNMCDRLGTRQNWGRLTHVNARMAAYISGSNSKLTHIRMWTDNHGVLSRSPSSL
jgi:hypothetical protein